MIATVVPATPFTVVRRVLAALVFEIELTIEVVVPTPLTVEVRVLTADPRTLELMILPVAATPLTVEVRVLTAEPRVLELIIGTVAPVTPLTVVESAFTDEVLETVVAPDSTPAMVW